MKLFSIYFDEFENSAKKFFFADNAEICSELNLNNRIKLTSSLVMNMKILCIFQKK